MSFFDFVRSRWLTIYTASVLASFGLGFLLRNQAPDGSSFYTAALLTLPWSALPDRLLPQPANAFLHAFYDLPLILSAMTLNIACVGIIQWVRSSGFTQQDQISSSKETDCAIPARSLRGIMTRPKRLVGREHAVYYGGTAILQLQVFPGETPGLYRAGVYDWLVKKPLYKSQSDSSLMDARSEAEQEAERHAGMASSPVKWRPGRDG